MVKKAETGDRPRVAGFEVFSAEQYQQLLRWRDEVAVTELELPVLAAAAEQQLKKPSLLYNLRDELDLLVRVMLDERTDSALRQAVVTTRGRLDQEFKRRKMDPDRPSSREPIDPQEAEYMVGYLAGGPYKTVQQCEWALRFAARILKRVEDARERNRIGDPLEMLARHKAAIEYGQRLEKRKGGA